VGLIGENEIINNPAPSFSIFPESFLESSRVKIFKNSLILLKFNNIQEFLKIRRLPK
jgi:hypothetical protein